jgi:hypothetical protein
LLNHPPPPTSTSHPNSPQHTALPLQTAIRPSLGHHHMLVYLTLMMQV